MCTTHAGLHALFGDDAETPVAVAPGRMPASGTVGERVTARPRCSTGGATPTCIATRRGRKIERIDSYAVEESLNPGYAVGFGDLSIHEFATDPDTNVAYIAYYAAGVRVFKFGPGGLVEQGRYIDEGGSNFWGIEV